MLLKKRTILLGVAITAFGAILVSSAFAAQSATRQSAPSTTVGVTAINADALTVEIVDQPATIPSDGVEHDAGRILATDGDSSYGYSISAPTLFSSGTFAGGCDEGSSIALGSAVGVPSTTGSGGPHEIGHLHLTFGVDSSATCTHSGAVVEAVFTVVGSN